MDDASIDLRDSRGRLIRLGIAAAFGLVVTIVVMHWINSVSPHGPNADPVGSSTMPLLAIGMFVTVTSLGAAVLTRFRRRAASSDR